MLTSIAIVGAMQIAAIGVSVGVALVSPDGQICVAMPARALDAGMSVTLIRPETRQSVLSVTIVRSEPTCERLDRALIPGPYYRAQPAASSAPAAGTLWVAFPGNVATRELASGAVEVQLSPAYRSARVRSCTSGEGLHLTVWSGSPLESARLWHTYFYLGYDVEPSCEDGDAREAAPPGRP